jgi:hypothetical protein
MGDLSAGDGEDASCTKIEKDQRRRKIQVSKRRFSRENEVSERVLLDQSHHLVRGHIIKDQVELYAPFTYIGSTDPFERRGILQ